MGNNNAEIDSDVEPDDATREEGFGSEILDTGTQLTTIDSDSSKVHEWDLVCSFLAQYGSTKTEAERQTKDYKVLMTGGPLAGISGHIILIREDLRVVLSVEFLSRPMLVEIDLDWVSGVMEPPEVE